LVTLVFFFLYYISSFPATKKRKEKKKKQPAHVATPQHRIIIAHARAIEAQAMVQIRAMEKAAEDVPRSVRAAGLDAAASAARARMEEVREN
jgi:hypothetical protein